MPYVQQELGRRLIVLWVETETIERGLNVIEGLGPAGLPVMQMPRLISEG